MTPLPEPPSTTSGLVAAVAGFGLTATATMLPRNPLDDAAWATLLEGVLTERLEGHLILAVIDGGLGVTAAQANQAFAHHRQAMALAVALENTLLEATAYLEEHGIDFRVLKGAAAAHLDYPDPSRRAFGDVDILVRGEQFDAAVATLTRAGFRRRMPQPRPGFDRRFGKGAVLVGPGELEVDVHRTFAAGPFGIMVDLADVWRGAVPFSVGGRQLWALGNEERFLNACYHAVLGDVPPRLSPQRDIAQMLQARELDFDRVRAYSANWQGDLVLASALRLVWDTFDLGDVNAASVWARDYQPTRRQQRDLAAYTSEHATYVSKSLAGLRAVPGLRLKMAYLWALGVPSRRYLLERDTSQRARWRRGLDDALVGRGNG